MLITWPSPIFDKNFFPAENAGNIPEKPVFLHFLEISSIVFFLIFYSKMQIRNVQNMAESNLRENFFPAENTGNMLEIAVSADFLWTFSTYFVVLFHTKVLMIFT